MRLFRSFPPQRVCGGSDANSFEYNLIQFAGQKTRSIPIHFHWHLRCDAGLSPGSPTPGFESFVCGKPPQAAALVSARRKTQEVGVVQGEEERRGLNHQRVKKHKGKTLLFGTTQNKRTTGGWFRHLGSSACRGGKRRKLQIDSHASVRRPLPRAGSCQALGS